MYHNYLQSVLNYFATMDINNLRLYLKDEYPYQDTTKEIFLNKVSAIFKSCQKLKDTKLIIYKGKCGGRTCDNCGKPGYRFVGNISKNHFPSMPD